MERGELIDSLSTLRELMMSYFGTSAELYQESAVMCAYIYNYATAVQVELAHFSQLGANYPSPKSVVDNFSILLYHKYEIGPRLEANANATCDACYKLINYVTEHNIMHTIEYSTIREQALNIINSLHGFECLCAIAAINHMECEAWFVPDGMNTNSTYTIGNQILGMTAVNCMNTIAAAIHSTEFAACIYHIMNGE